MKSKALIFVCLITFVIGIVSCNNTDINKPTPKQAGDLIRYKWMKLEIINNIGEDVGYDMSLIDIIFDTSNDIRNDLSVDLRIRPFSSKKISDMNKFEQVFNEELQQGTLYTNYYEPTGDSVLADMTYNPLQEYYKWDGEDIAGTLTANSSKKYYCWNIGRGEYGVSAVYSVMCRLAVGDKKFVLPGWDQSLYKYDVSDDTIIVDNLEIYEDNYNPQNETNSERSKSFLCDCYELTITINGDTTEDIFLTKNCVNPWNE